MSEASVPPFAVISGRQVHQILENREPEVVELIAAAYRTHGLGDTVNPPSYFLTFPDRPSARIIALPADIGGDVDVTGMKWISSFPENIKSGRPRASAVLILNDRRTGYPFACLESSIISATRTAASAALAADVLTKGRPRPRRLGIVGAGLIAKYVHRYLARTGWTFDEVGVHDLSTEYAGGLRRVLLDAGTPSVTIHDTAEGLVGSSDLIVFATTAGAPYLSDLSCFAHNPLVLHVSLRDLAPEIVLESTNVLDDVEHCLKADTSVHLAEQLCGNRDFVHGTLFDVMEGEVPGHTGDRPLIFSPFGLGVLDLAVGQFVYDALHAHGELAEIDGFFYELARHGG